ncbi:MAG: NAD(P)-dependent glycerol-1-phosphate dehydrogenase [Candidatus Saliniplasma sp.]
MATEDENEKQREGVQFSKLKSMQFPRTVVVGNDAIKKVPETVKSLNLKGKSLIICDGTTRDIAGDHVSGLMEENSFITNIYEIENASQKTVDDITENSKGEYDFFFGVGGGRSIDVAKYSSHLLDVPFISVPTAASHDGIASGRASIDRNGNKKSVAAQSPLAVVADTSIISESPYRLMASGCADIISNETAVLDWQLAKRLRNESYSHYAANLSKMTASSLIDNADSIKPGLEESAWLIVKALVSSSVAMSIAGSSRPASGSEHKFSHSIDELVEKPALHGEQCGVGTIIMMYLHGGDWKRIKNALEEVGAPTTARGLDLTEEEVIEALIHAPEIRPERYTILGNRRMNRDAAEEAAKETGII